MRFASLLLAALFSIALNAQDEPKSVWDDSNFSGLKLRSIGPAFMSGRIADIAIHPDDDNVWYVAVGSGGVWKTVNAGVTWKPLFDGQSVYSTGCVTIDPNNPHTIWVGTGENVGGRHVGWGNGIYRSRDGGQSWENLGLKKSEHISKIIVHPSDPNTVWAACQGPLWSKGGERGFYKTTDGGKTWKRTLGNAEWTGVTDIAIDPRNPDRIYAATWDRHRTVAAYMGGGPGTGLHRSLDGGETWEQLKKGLPTSNMGKIGLAISPQQPDVLYAAIELDLRTGGVYKSTDRGSSWTKQSDAVAGATGPHYYQELYACPHNFDRLYLVDVRMQISDNGGKTFRRMKENAKHSDNHALAFRQDDPDYLLVGTDGGIYESFDLAENWRFMSNLPLTQFYKLALDDAEPFYNVFGGTQDNSTEGGPSRTDNVHGIQNSDWKVVLNWDGHQPATEPGNPNIMYGQRQQGTLSRIDMVTGEVTDIQPRPGEGEKMERYNWDAPILVSPHAPAQIYFGSQRLWRSDNRGDKWTAISPDLTRNEERLELPILGKQQSWDNPWDLLAMSKYNTITSIAESPVQRDLLYVGTDDGMIHVSENGGTDWRKIDVSSLSGVPARTYVNDIKADLYDANTVYVALDAHKMGNYKPFLFKSTDKGKSWVSIKNNLPDETIVWRIAQDHVQKDLIFLGTEYGIYFTVNGGKRWVKLKGGVPTIPFRDIAIQKRENDLVGASFGRSFYVLDDYTALRSVTESQLNAEATLFPIRKAWWYVPRPHLSFDDKRGSQGAAHFVADNPPFGAMVTYYLKEDLKSKKQLRTDKEKELTKNKSNIPFPGWDELEAERMENAPKIWLVVHNRNGEVIRRIPGATKKGFHRTAWDLRFPAPNAIRLGQKAPEPGKGPKGMMAPPGTYQVTLYKEVDNQMIALSAPQSVEVVPLRKGALDGVSPQDTYAFWRNYEKTVRDFSATQIAVNRGMKKVAALGLALRQSTTSPDQLVSDWNALHTDMKLLDARLNGNRTRGDKGLPNATPTIGNRLFDVARTISNSTYGPTETAKSGLSIAQTDLGGIQDDLAGLEKRIDALAKALVAAGGPMIEGVDLPKE